MAVTTRPKKDGKPPKRKTKRLYGATRTDSGLNLEVQSYETALRQRRVRKEADGSEDRVYNTRLSTQPVLTRYVEEPSTGAKRYRPPRFAGPAY